MTPQQYERVREIFLAARDLSEPRRSTYLAEACGGDAPLRAEVESLLANDAQAASFLKTPALGRSFALDDLDAHIRKMEPGSRPPSAADVDVRAPALAPHPERIGEYRILSVLGQGGMGVVYQAEQDRPRRIVALKVIRPGIQSHEVLKRFAQEAEVLGWLQHPGIAQIYEAGTADTGLGPQPFFAMELVRGVPLTTYAERRRLGIRERLDLLAKVCDAMHHAHQKGVIHRDLKPGNILVDEAGNPKILDFGVARATDADVRVTTLYTAAGQLVGTIAYMSPEQVSGDPRQLDIRSDIYALGVIGYELLTGRLPVDISEKTLPQAARAIVEEEPAPLHSINRLYRGDIETIIAKALEKDKTRRYASACDLAEDIRRFLADQPISAHPPTTMYQLRKFACRNKPLVAGAIVALVTLVAGAVTATSEAVRATRARTRAVTAERLAEQREQAAEFRAYVACIAAAQAALNADDVVIARQQLERAPPDLRNWEWSFLHARLDASQAVLREHAARVWAVAFTPDGGKCATAGTDETVYLRDSKTGAVLQTFLADRVQLRCLAVSPDGRSLVAGTEKGGILWWNIGTGEQFRTWTGHSGVLTDIAFSPDGARFVSTSLDGTARLWDVATGRLLHALPHPGWVYHAAFTSDGARLVTNCRDNVVRWWDAGSGEILLSIAVAPQTRSWDFVHSWAVTISPDGRTVATGGHDGLIRLWDPTTGSAILTMPGHRGRIRCLAYSPDGKQLASGSDDATIRIWDPVAGTERATLLGHEGFVQRLAYSPDGSRLISGADDRTVRLWDPRVTHTGTTLSGHDNTGVRTLAIAPDETRIVSGGEDGTVRVWDARSGAGLMVLRGHTGPVYSAACSPDGAWIASAGHDATVRLWNAGRGELVTTLVGHDRPVAAVAFTPDGQRLLSASWDGTLRLWDVSTSASVQTWVSEGQSLTAMALSPDGAQVACGTKLGAVEFRDARTGRESRIVNAHKAVVVGLAFSRDGTRLASASYDKNLVVFDARTATPLATLSGHTEPVLAAAFNPDGTRLASVSFDRTLRLWDVGSAQSLLSFRAHTDYGFAVAFSPGGTWLTSGSKNILLWECRPPDPETLARRRVRVVAEDLVDRLSMELSGWDEVRARLETDESEPADVRASALQTVRFRSR